MGYSITQDKSYKFALRIVKMYKHLCEVKNERTLSKQVLRSGTSIGANIEEAEVAISHREFIAKIQISYKEAKETIYWLRLLHDSEYIDDDAYKSIMKDAIEVSRLICSILKTSKKKFL